MPLRTRKLHAENNTDISPLNLTERSVPPTAPEVDDIYLDDGTNYGSGSGIPGWRRWTGTAWEDISGAGGGGVTNLDGGRADSNYGGVGLSPLDGGNASSW